jgi:hypothetical protein
LEPYERRLTERFGRKFTRSLSDFLPFGLKHYAARKLMASRWFARKVIVDRWFLHRHEPALST